MLVSIAGLAEVRPVDRTLVGNLSRKHILHFLTFLSGFMSLSSRDRWTTMDSKCADKDPLGESNVKYSALAHEGLEVVDQDHAPEAVTPSSLNRKSSLLQPEAYHAAPYYKEDSYHDSPQALPPDHEGPQVIHNKESKEPMIAEAQEVNGRQEKRRCCGMRRGVFIGLLVAVIFLVCVAAILGGVLGTQLDKRCVEKKIALPYV